MKKKAFAFMFVTALIAIMNTGNFYTLKAQSWTSADGGGSIGMDSLSSAFPISSDTFNNALYAIWYQPTSKGQIHIKKYDGTSWTTAGNSSGQSRLNESDSITTDPVIATCNGYLYAAWEEHDKYGGTPSIHVKRYNGSSWTFVQNYSSGDGRVNINHSITSLGSGVHLCAFNNELYAAWLENYNGTYLYQIRVSKFNGSYWTCIDGDKECGINFDTLQTGYPPKFGVYDGNLYICWTELNSSNINQFHVKRYDGGSTWTSIDGGTVDGLNFSTSKGVDGYSLVSTGSKLYAFWQEQLTTSLRLRVRAKQYDATNGWSSVAGADTGWLHNGNSSGNPSACAYNNILYVGFEDNVPPRQIRAVSFDGASKTYIDGNGTKGINCDTLKRAHLPALTVYNECLYALWFEDRDSNNSYFKLRAKKYLSPAIVTSVSVPSNATYITGQSMNFTVNFNKAVTISGGTPYLTLTLDSGGSVNATYASGSGSKVLVFNYTVAAGNYDNSGITMGTGITLPSGCTLRDANSSDANLTLNSAGSTSGVLVDGIAPYVSSINRKSPSAAQTNGITAIYLVTFSDNVTGVDISDFALTKTGTAGGTVSSVSASSGTTFDVTISSVTGDGTLRLELNSSGTGITDAPGNAIATGFTEGQTYVIDKTAPSVSSINRQNPTDSLTSAASVTFRVTFSENVVNVSSGSFTLTTSGITGTIASVSASYGQYVDVTINSISGEGTLRLDLASSGTGITDSAGNEISGGFTGGQQYAITMLPVVKTNPVTGIGMTTATGNGDLTSLGASNPASYGVCWSTAANPDTGKNKTDNGAVSSTGTFTAPITGLSPGTTYHVRAFAGNSYGISYGADTVFTAAYSYTVTYDGNTNTGGAVPVDANIYEQSSTVTILGNTGSLAKTGYTFNGWNTAADGSGTGYAAGAAFSMGTSDVTLYAQWTNKKYTLTVSAANGSVARNPDETSFDSNSVVVLAATPDAGYSFWGWSGDTTASSSSISLTMKSDMNLTANFAAKICLLTVNAGTGGAITVPSSSTLNLNYGETATITASPSDGYSFVKWTRTNTNAAISDSTKASATITLTDSATVTAVFSLNAPSVPIAVLPSNRVSATADSMQFVWNMSSQQVDMYCLLIASDSAMSDIYFVDSTIADTAFLKRSITIGKTFYWQVKAHNASGWSAYCDVRWFVIQASTTVLPREFSMALSGASGKNGRIKFGLPGAALVNIRLFNIQGKTVRAVYSRQLAAGYHIANIDLSNVSKGLYVLEFTAGQYSSRKTFSYLVE